MPSPRKPVVIITAGATSEPLDPVRVLTNRSSGKMGVALLQESLRRRYPTVLVHGDLSVPLPEGRYRTVEAKTARAMLRTLLDLAPEDKILLMAAAVSDFRPAKVSRTKIRRGSEGLVLRLVPNPDVLATVVRRRRPLVAVGFAAETLRPGPRLAAKGQEKLLRKGVDLLLANEVGRGDAGFGSDYGRAVLLAVDRPPRPLGRLPKSGIARALFDEVERLLERRGVKVDMDGLRTYR